MLPLNYLHNALSRIQRPYAEDCAAALLAALSRVFSLPYSSPLYGEEAGEAADSRPKNPTGKASRAGKQENAMPALLSSSSVRNLKRADSASAARQRAILPFASSVEATADTPFSVRTEKRRGFSAALRRTSVFELSSAEELFSSPASVERPLLFRSAAPQTGTEENESVREKREGFPPRRTGALSILPLGWESPFDFPKVNSRPDALSVPAALSALPQTDSAVLLRTERRGKREEAQSERSAYRRGTNDGTAAQELLERFRDFPESSFFSAAHPASADANASAAVSLHRLEQRLPFGETAAFPFTADSASARYGAEELSRNLERDARRYENRFALL